MYILIKICVKKKKMKVEELSKSSLEMKEKYTTPMRKLVFVLIYIEMIKNDLFGKLYFQKIFVFCYLSFKHIVQKA